MSTQYSKSNDFSSRIDQLLKTEHRYQREAYAFVSDAVTYTVRKLEHHRHVSALELLAGIRDYAGQEFGIFAGTVLTEWGIHRASDVGNLVYLMIGTGILSASPEDSQEDFNVEFELTIELEKANPGAVPQLPKID